MASTTSVIFTSLFIVMFGLFSGYCGPEIVIDGGSLLTLNGGSQRRIRYMNACDPDLVCTRPHCHNQDHPRLTVQNLTFVNGYTSGADPGDGGAIFIVSNDRSGTLHIDPN